MAWAPDYVTLQDFKHYLKVDEAETSDDAELSGKITAASRSIDRFTGRQFGKVEAPELRSYEPWFNRRMCKWVVTVDDFQNVAGLTITSGGIAMTGTPEPLNAVLRGKAFTRIVLDGTPAGGTVDILLSWGWNEFPDAVVEACKLQGSRFLARRDSPWGVAGSPDTGAEIRLQARVDPDVAVMLGDYYRPRGFG